jgi:hypothetical protein
MYVSCNMEDRSRNHSCRGKAMSTKRYECVCILASFLRRAVTPVTCLVDHIFPHCLIKDATFGRKKSLNIKCVLISSKNSV